MNASDFDHLDRPDRSDGLGPDLTARLRAAAGAEPDLATAHAVLGRRVAGARRRRAAAVTGSAGLTVLLLGTVYAVNTGDRGGRISSADAPAVASFGDDDSATSVTATSVATTVETVVTTLPGTPVGAAASPAGPGASAATSSSVDDADDGSGESEIELFDVTAAATEVRTVSGIGGSVDVRVENGVLSFASFPIAAEGFTAQVTRDEPGRLEVTFTSGSHRTRLRVRLDGDRWRADRHEEPTSSVPGAPTGTAPHTTNDDGDDDGSDDHGTDSGDDSNDDADDPDDSNGSGGSANDSSDSNDSNDSSGGGEGSGGSGSGGSKGGSGSGGSGSGG